MFGRQWIAPFFLIQMIVNWYFLIVGLVAVFLPARWLTTGDCRQLEFMQIKAMRIDKNKRRRRWWKARHVWIEPVRGIFGAWALKESLSRDPSASGLVCQLPAVIVLTVLALSILLQTMGRRKKVMGRRKTPDEGGGSGNANGVEAAGSSVARDSDETKTSEEGGYWSSSSSSTGFGRTSGIVRAVKPLNAPLLFMGGMVLGLFGLSIPVLAVAVVLMGVVGLLAFHHWGTAAMIAGVTMAIVGYLMLNKSLYVPGVMVILMEPMLLSWYLQRPLVMAVRI